MRRFTKTIALFSIALAAPLLAQPTEVPGAVDVSRVAAGTYAADPSHSLIEWEVSHFGLSNYFGLFGDITGTLEIDPAMPEAAKVDVMIPVSSITTVSEGLTGHLLRPGKDGAKPDFFGPEPADAHFVSTGIQVSGTTATMTGNLTLNGVTKPVTMEVEFTGAGTNPFNKKDTIGFEAETTIKRSDFGIGFLVPLVSDEVELDISIAFEKQ